MIKTNIELLNEISAKLGGKSDASVLVEGLNNIANALGDTDPDQMVTVPQALETVLEHMDGGGGGSSLKGKIMIKVVNNSNVSLYPFVNMDYRCPVYLVDGMLRWDNIDEIKPNEEKTLECYAVASLDYDTEQDLYEIDATTIISAGGAVTIAPITDLVNCTADDMLINITDLSKEASCTITFEGDR